MFLLLLIFLILILLLINLATPYPNGPSYVGFFVVTSLDFYASSFHVQNFQDHEPIPHVDLSYFCSNMEPNPPCKKQKFVDGKT
jgi:hypothetical protein